jgi:hypothetical protein
MLVVVFAFRKWMYFVQGAQHKTILYSDHQDLTYFKTAISLNRRQARWAEELLSYSFNMFYRKGSSNQKADMLSRCPAFTSREGSTTAAGQQTLLQKEQWVEIGAMQLDDDENEIIMIRALEGAQLLPEAKERIKERALLDDKYVAICKQLFQKAMLLNTTRFEENYYAGRIGFTYRKDCGSELWNRNMIRK